MINICNIITKICDDENINSENFLDGLNYIENLARFLDTIKIYVPLNRLTFLPSFKGKYVSERLGILSNDKENEMKLFKIKSDLFVEDSNLLKIKKDMSKICDVVYRDEVDNNCLIFILK